MGHFFDLSIWSRASWVIHILLEMAKPSWGNTSMVVTYLRMVPLRNSLKIADTLYLTYPNHLPDQPTMNNTLTTLPTLMIYPHCWVYHGNEKKTCRLLVQPPTSASYGTLPPFGYPYHWKRRQYLAAIQDWTDSKTHILNNVEKLYGKLLHTCSIIPRGCAFLTKLEAMLGLFGSN